MIEGAVALALTEMTAASEVLDPAELLNTAV
jgi:hypothetical protein